MLIYQSKNPGKDNIGGSIIINNCIVQSLFTFSLTFVHSTMDDPFPHFPLNTSFLIPLLLFWLQQLILRPHKLSSNISQSCTLAIGTLSPLRCTPKIHHVKRIPLSPIIKKESYSPTQRQRTIMLQSQMQKYAAASAQRIP
mmetsp:Transcript_16155/g.29292  ORF Transcript_16155/g.29292 Transcript_16155/m.29292 type:complete len:141 (+) Transcript_16155:132-554(+)